MAFDLSTAQPADAISGGFDLSTAKSVYDHNTPAPDDSPLVSSIKQLGTSAARVGAKTVAALPLMAMDFGVGARNLASMAVGQPKGDTTIADRIRNAIGGGTQYEYPSDTFNKGIDAVLPAPTDKAGKNSEMLSELVASLFAPGPNGVKAAGDAVATVKSLVGADAVKARAMAAAKRNGIVIPPSLTKDPAVAANLANGYGGGAETLKVARDLNTPGINGIVAKDLGLDAGSELTTGPNGNITQQINDAVQRGYAPLREIGDIPLDQAHFDAMRKLGGADRGASAIDPSLGNPQIAELARALSPTNARVSRSVGSKTITVPGEDNGLGSLGNATSGPSTVSVPVNANPGRSAVDPLTLNQRSASFDSGDMVDAISALRAKASDAFTAGNGTLGKAYKQAANALESQIDRHLQSKGADAEELLNNFRVARTRIAKGHDAMEALNPSTGDIDPRRLAALDDGQLSGGLKDAADIARAFPDAVVPSKGTPSPVTAFQGNMIPGAMAAEPVTGTASVLAGLLGRNAARKYALSKDVQQSLMQPKTMTLSKKAMDSVMANPTAFSSLYEDMTK